MIKFEKVEPKLINVYKDDDFLVKLDIVSSTITNKFNLVTSYVEDISEYNKDFDYWFESLVNEYIDSNERFMVLEKHIPALKEFSDDYITSRNIDFSKFTDESKAKKSTILFSPEEIEKIIRLSGYLKIYSIFSNSENLKLDQRLHKEAYNELAKDIDMELIYKIFNVIRTKTFKYNMTDRYMWDYIKMIQCKTIDVHVIQIFNFIMNSILVLCEIDKNPITYFVTVVDESVKWFLRSVYKASVVYDDSVSTEDIQSTNRDNLRTYAYNDTLGRLKGLAYKQIHESLERNYQPKFNSDSEASDSHIIQFQRRIENVKYISPFCDFLVYPILAGITRIPYNHLKALSPEHSIILSVYVKGLLEKVYYPEFGSLFEMLNYYPEHQPSLITTYKLKNIQYFINFANTVNNFYGFETKILLCDMLSNFVGKISRCDFINIFDGQPLKGIPVSKLETEMIQFYTYFFSGKIEEKFPELRKDCLMEF